MTGKDYSQHLLTSGPSICPYSLSQVGKIGDKALYPEGQMKANDPSSETNEYKESTGGPAKKKHQDKGISANSLEELPRCLLSRVTLSYST